MNDLRKYCVAPSEKKLVIKTILNTQPQIRKHHKKRCSNSPGSDRISALWFHRVRVKSAPFLQSAAYGQLASENHALGIAALS